ncbi:MAG: hypothetical protein CMI56_00090 [Parcubacteria group bacterium]|nr:hypothetical protein [Parcubacteria group bacterium]
MKLEYFKYATNNLDSIIADCNGARCVHCLQAPTILKNTKTCDVSTVICPLCGVDAVVPASVVINEAILLKWHNEGFKE